MTDERLAFTPRYYMRHALVHRTLRTLPARTLVEFGCGAGHLLVELAERGYRCIGVEPSHEAAEQARRRTAPFPAVRVASDPAVPPSKTLPIGVALEVLEHVADDRETLNSWSRWLSPGATLVVSVPARSDLWTHADTAAGHLRRYERDELESLLQGCGYTIDHLWTYGFPLTTLTRQLRRRHVMSRREPMAISPMDRTLESSFISELGSRKARAYAFVGKVGHLAQLPFLRSGLGDGFFVVARRR